MRVDINLSVERKVIMKKILIATLVATSAIASPAWAAPSTSDSFDVNAHVAKTCTMEGLNDINLGALSINETAGSNALLLNSDTSATGNHAWLSCNDTNVMSIGFTGGHVPLLRSVSRDFQPGVDDPGFKDTINYRLDVNNYRSSGTQPFCQSVATSGCHLITQPRGAVHRQISFTARVLASDNQDARPLADLYSDTVTVTVSTV